MSRYVTVVSNFAANLVSRQIMRDSSQQALPLIAAKSGLSLQESIRLNITDYAHLTTLSDHGARFGGNPDSRTDIMI